MRGRASRPTPAASSPQVPQSPLIRYDLLPFICSSGLTGDLVNSCWPDDPLPCRCFFISSQAVFPAGVCDAMTHNQV